MKYLVISLMLFSMSAQAKWHHYAIGGVLGALAANALSAPAQSQQPQQVAPSPL